MGSSVIWVFFFTGLYWAYCLFWGVKGYYRARTASDYFLAGRQIPMWVFVLAATATSFSGWTFIGHPYLISVDGLPYAFASFYVITIPLTGTLFLKRQWMLGKRFGYVTPGEMYSDYYGSEAMRWLTVLVALTYSIPYLALQFRASGVLFSILTDGAVDVTFGMWALSLIVLIYVALGGLRSVAYVDTAQCLMLTAGIVVLGLITIVKVGGWSEFVSAFGDTIAREMAADADLLGRPVLTPDGYHRMVGVPGAIQAVPAASQAEGGIWTGTMILTYLFALAGIQASPAFSMWAFANTNPRPFAPQQVWASALGVGVCLFVFSTLQGLGGRILIGKGLLPLSLLEPGGQDQLVPALANLVAEQAPILVALLAVCALAAMQSTGSAYMSTTGGMITRDVYVRYVNPRASGAQQKAWGRLWVCGITLGALVVATYTEDALVMLGGLAVAYGSQMWVPLAGALYFPWLTRQGVTWGLVAGLAGVTLTYPFHHPVVQAIQGFFGFGPYPLTIHCAGWGILANVAVALAVSAFTQPGAEEFGRRFEYHRFLRRCASVSAPRRRLRPVGWAVVAVWVAFAIGPLSVLGNDCLFFDGRDPSTWPLGIPPLWLWQLAWWGGGVFMMWFLAYKLEFSTRFSLFDVVREDHSQTYGERAPLQLDLDEPGV